MSAAEVTTSEEKPEHKLDSVLNEDQLHAALKKLPETFRAPLLLRYFSGFPAYNQIAAILSLPIGTVRSRLNEAKLKLAKKWEQPVDSALDAAKERDEWNSFYFDTFSGIHDHDGCKNKFMEHLHKNVELVYPNGKSNTGSWVFEKMIMDDRDAGSWLKPSNVVSSGNISIIETNHFNSPEHPHHCPAHSVLVLQRNNREVSKMNLYLSWQ